MIEKIVMKKKLTKCKCNVVGLEAMSILSTSLLKRFKSHVAGSTSVIYAVSKMLLHFKIFCEEHGSRRAETLIDDQVTTEQNDKQFVKWINDESYPRAL